MPTARHVSRKQTSPASSQPQVAFKFPSTDHLLITTASHIFAWDSLGIHTIFKSSKEGIVAAREAKDESGILAVADKRVVILHNTKRGQERSWGLEADGDEVRYLAYTSDAKSLFFSTNLSTDIQQYSTARSRLLSPARTHVTPPVALAVSPTGHLLVSASDDPPVTYLKDLAHNSAPVLIESRTSETAVSSIAFHPERPNIFLLAFRDGTVAAFDATKARQSRGGTLANQVNVNAGEIGHLTKLHRTTFEAAHTTCIANAAFLPGYKTRAITVGSDGRCRLIDFADGGVVLRTWHAKAPVTSVSVCSQKSETENRNQSAGSRASHTIGGPMSTNNLIAIGRADGQVNIYDSVGLLLSQQLVSERSEKVISVEWAKGPSPRPISDTVVIQDVGDIPNVSSPQDRADSAGTVISPSNVGNTTDVRRGTTFGHVGLPPALRKPKERADRTVTLATRKFTIHPDEVDGGTVRHTPMVRGDESTTINKGQYLDLFSPVKPVQRADGESAMKRVSSPPRSRPRISPQTFVKSPEATSTTCNGAVAQPKNLALFPSTDSGPDPVQPSVKKTGVHVGQPKGHNVSPFVKKKEITFKTTSQRRSRRSEVLDGSHVVPNNNAKVLADLRKLSLIHPTHRNGAVLSAFAAENTSHKGRSFGSSCKGQSLRVPSPPTDLMESDSEDTLNERNDAHGKPKSPKGSNLDDSLNGDIWLTSDSDSQATYRRRTKHQHVSRPPARQTSRSRVDSKGTMSTVAQRPAALLVHPNTGRQAVDGSTDEDMYTAETHVSSTGTFSPSSNDVRELFPRSSSLPPKKRRRPPKRLQRSPQARDDTLREIALNIAVNSHTKSPWARARAVRKKENAPGSTGKGRQVKVLMDDPEQMAKPDPCQSALACTFCYQTRARVQTLEDEVSRLKGEVLALKALRRNCVPLPMSVR